LHSPANAPVLALLGIFVQWLKKYPIRLCHKTYKTGRLIPAHFGSFLPQAYTWRHKK